MHCVLTEGLLYVYVLKPLPPLQSWESRSVSPRFFFQPQLRQGPLKEVDVSINNSPGLGLRETHDRAPKS